MDRDSAESGKITKVIYEKKAREEGKIETAKAMKTEGFDNETIKRLTDQEIE